MRQVHDTREAPAWGRVFLLGLLAALVAIVALAYLRAQYGWRDAFDVLWRLAMHLSRKRLGLALVASVPLVWLVLRWRSAPHVVYLALFFYFAGVLADALILLSLAPLGISFGPALLPLALLAGVRCALTLGLGLLGWIVGRPCGPWLHGAGQLLLFVVVVNGFVIEPNHLTVSYVRLADPYHTGGRPLRIVQVSDLHIERANDLSRRIVETVNGLEPDLIVLTGDYLSSARPHDPQAQADLRALAGGLQARHGIYAVCGNVDNPQTLPHLLQGLPITFLDGDWLRQEIDGRAVVIAGVSMGALERDRRALRHVASTMPRGCFSILLYHSPNLVPEAAAAGFDLHPTGHTHGGQIRLPLYGALTTFSIYGKRYEMGPYRVGDTLVYVSRGIGMEGWLMPRMRFLCPPEVVCYEVE